MNQIHIHHSGKNGNRQASPQPGEKLKVLLGFASEGLRLAPCYTPAEKPRGEWKHPRIEQWQLRATADRRQVIEWHRKWPHANWAIACGRESGVVVLDIDDRHGGRESLHSLVVKHRRLPKTRIVRTPHGHHIYFRYPEGYPSSKRRLCSKICG